MTSTKSMNIKILEIIGFIYDRIVANHGFLKFPQTMERTDVNHTWITDDDRTGNV